MKRAEAPDALRQYLRDIGSYPLIGREEEARLARRIREGDQEALHALVRANLRFVVSVAKRYQQHELSLTDLVNEGNLGLIHAARRFDESKGIRFISYAVWWIRQAIQQALAEQGGVVRVPLHRVEVLRRVGRRARALEQELGRPATSAEIADQLELSESEVENVLATPRTHVSLDAPLKPGADDRLLDYLADDGSPTPDEQAFERALADAVDESLAGLKEREAKILRLYFGLGGEAPMTLEQIGVALAITRERVRQIKERALWKLRHARGGRRLKTFLG